MKEINIRPFLIQKLRSASMSWPPRNEALKRARVSRGLYMCSICGETYKRKMMHVDHIDPVVDPSIGWVDWNTFISRLFCDADGFQAICSSCHSLKTEQEAELRKFHKRYVKIQGFEDSYEINKKGVVRCFRGKNGKRLKKPKKLEPEQTEEGRWFVVIENTPLFLDELILKHFTDDWEDGCSIKYRDFNPSNLLFSNLIIVKGEDNG